MTSRECMDELKATINGRFWITLNHVSMLLARLRDLGIDSRKLKEWEVVNHCPCIQCLSHDVKLKDIPKWKKILGVKKVFRRKL